MTIVEGLPVTLRKADEREPALPLSGVSRLRLLPHVVTVVPLGEGAGRLQTCLWAGVPRAWHSSVLFGGPPWGPCLHVSSRPGQVRVCWPSRILTRSWGLRPLQETGLAAPAAQAHRVSVTFSGRHRIRVAGLP